MAEIKHSKRKMTITVNGYSVAVKKYEVERRYDYSSKAAFNKERINIAAGPLDCKLTVYGSIYADSSPALAFDSMVKAGNVSGFTLDNVVFSNMAISFYRITTSNDDLSREIVLEFTSTASTGGPVYV